jgi:hypothetical protein
MRLLPVVQLGLLDRSLPFALATFMPSPVRSRIGSENSATIARTLNSNRPTGTTEGAGERWPHAPLTVSAFETHSQGRDEFDVQMLDLSLTRSW